MLLFFGENRAYQSVSRYSKVSGSESDVGTKTGKGILTIAPARNISMRPIYYSVKTSNSRLAPQPLLAIGLLRAVCQVLCNLGEAGQALVSTVMRRNFRLRITA